MDLDTVVIIVAILGAGIALWRVLDVSLREIRRDIGDLRERMARLEGLFNGFTARQASG